MADSGIGFARKVLNALLGRLGLPNAAELLESFLASVEITPVLNTEGEYDIRTLPDLVWEFGGWKFQLAEPPLRLFAPVLAIAEGDPADPAQNGWLKINTVKLVADTTVVSAGIIVPGPPKQIVPDTKGGPITLTLNSVTLKLTDGKFDISLDKDSTPVQIDPNILWVSDRFGLEMSEMSDPVIDLSREETPPAVKREAAWRGFQFSRAHLYINEPSGLLRDPIEIGDLAWGLDGDGLSGTARIKLERPGSTALPSWFQNVVLDLEIQRNQLVKCQLNCSLDMATIFPGVPEAGATSLVDVLLSLGWGDPMGGQPVEKPPQEGYFWLGAVTTGRKDTDGIFALTEFNIVRQMTGSLLLPPAAASKKLSMVEAAAVFAFGAGLSASSVITPERFVLRGLRIRYAPYNDDAVDRVMLSLTTDYSLRFKVDLDLGLTRFKSTQASTVEISDLGIGFDTKNGWNPVFYFDSSKGLELSLADPGLAGLGGLLGNIFDLSRARLGTGSPIWLDLELKPNLNAGVFRLDRLGIRVDIGSPFKGGIDDQIATIAGRVQLTSIGVTADVPGVFAGTGYLRVDEGGSDSQLGLTIVPLQLAAQASLSLREKNGIRSVLAALETQFSPGFPIGTSGAALFGLSGLFAMHFGPNKTDLAEWYFGEPAGASHPDKWDLAQNKWAFGVGAVIGSAPDGASLLNAKGAIVIAVPGPRFLFAMRANLLTKRPEVSGSNAQGVLDVVLVLDFHAGTFLLGIRLKYDLAGILRVDVPVEAFFSLRESGNWYLHAGKDKPAEQSISLRVFGVWEARGYLMVDGRGILNLANSGVSLPATAVAFGARIQIAWGARSIGLYLEAHAEIHVGVGFRPAVLIGKAAIGGGLHLIILSLGVSGGLDVVAAGGSVYFKAHVCGSIKILIKRFKKCLTFQAGSLPTVDPDPAVAQLVLRNRLDDSVRMLKDGSKVDLTNAPIDCRPGLEFKWKMQSALEGKIVAGLKGSSFSVQNNSTNPDDYKERVGEEDYRFTLTRLTLRKDTDPEGAVPVKIWSAVWLQTDGGQKHLSMLDTHLEPFSNAFSIEGARRTRMLLTLATICEPPSVPPMRCFDFDGQIAGVSNTGWLLRNADVTWTIDIPPSPNTDPSMIRPSAVVESPVRQSRPDLRSHWLRLPEALQAVGRHPLETLIEPSEPLAEIEITVATSEVTIPWPGGPAAVTVESTVTAVAWLSDTAAGKSAQPTRSEVMTFIGTNGPSAMFGQSDARGLQRAERQTLSVRHLHYRASSTEQIVKVALTTKIVAQNIDVAAIEFSRFQMADAFVLGVCCRSAEDRARQEGLNKDREDQKNRQAAGAPAPETVLLERDTRYIVEAVVKWTGKKGEKEQPPFTESFKTTDVAPELKQYVARFFPATNDAAHYSGHGIGLGLRTNLVPEIYRRFGLELAFEVKGADGSIPPDAKGIPPDTKGESLSKLAYHHKSPYERLVSNVAATAPCGSVKPALPVRYFPKLARNTSYRVRIFSRSTGDSSIQTEQADIPWSFTTSRYANLLEHALAHKLQFDVVLDQPLGQPALEQISMLLGSDLVVSDRRLEDILVDQLRIGPLKAAARPEITRLWSQEAEGWRAIGVLLDGPEPFLRLRPEATLTTKIRLRDGAAEIPFRGVTSAQGTRTMLWFTPAPRTIQMLVSLHCPDDLAPGGVLEADVAIPIDFGVFHSSM